MNEWLSSPATGGANPAGIAEAITCLLTSARNITTRAGAVLETQFRVPTTVPR